MAKNNSKKKSGFTLVETIFYIAVFALFSIVVIRTLLVMTKAFRETSVYSDLVKASSIVEHISREVKQSTSVAAIDTDTLLLNTQDSEGEDTTIEFDLAGSDIVLSLGGVEVGNLNSPNVVISNLSFTQINTGEGQAVKVYMSLYSSRDRQSRVFEFYDTMVLRESY